MVEKEAEQSCHECVGCYLVAGASCGVEEYRQVIDICEIIEVFTIIIVLLEKTS